MHLIKYFTCLGLLLFLAACQNNATGVADNNNDGQQAKETTSPSVNPGPVSSKKTILFFGNSLTAGLGVDPSEAFAGLIQQRIDSLELPYEVINSGVSGETTSGGLGRIDWILDQYEIDIFILELGGNDALRGIDPAVPLKNLQAIIDNVKAKYPQADIVLAGMEAPPNLGQEYTSAFRNMYPTLAKKNNTLLIPFLLEGVGGIPELNQQDGIHPTPEGHRIVADLVWKILKELI